MLTLIHDYTTQNPVRAITPITEYQSGYNAYFMRRGPGIGLLRTAGWLQAARDERAELAAEWQQLADERLDENDRHYRWMY